MTAMPAPSHEPTTPDHLSTVADYAQLGETEPGYTELVAGRLLMSPSPTPKHNIASGELFVQLRDQLPERLPAILDVESGYQDDQRVTGTFTTKEPFPVTLDLERLR